MTNSNKITYENVKVNNVRFSSDNFCIFIGLVDGIKKTFTGNLSVSKGEKLNIVGERSIHQKYGEQIKIISFEKNDNIDTSDLKDYLKSFKGIGDSKAKKILDAFGDDAIEIIKTDYTKLIPLGIKEPLAREMHNSLCKNKVLNEMVQKLGPFGISLNTINKIYEKYQEESLEVLKYNPYKIKEFFNISFDVLDNFSLKSGIRVNSVSRIIGGIREAVSFFTAMGHTYVYVSDIIERTKLRLNKNITDEVNHIVNADIIKTLIYLSEEEKELIIDNDSAVYTPHFYYAERNIARKILKLNKSCYETVLVKSFEEILKDVTEEVGITYSPNQQFAIEVALKKAISIITGGPGTGKTTTVNGYIRALKKNNPEIKILLAAPTGKAAKRMEESTGMKATTIHRLLEYKPFGGELLCGRNEENPMEADVIIVDEFSMMDVSLMEKFLKAIKEGTKLTFVGDIDQLPSVGPGNVLKDLIASNVISIVKLDTIFRQQGTSPIVTNAYNINNGLGLDFTHKDFNFIEIVDEDTVVAKEMVKKFEEYLKSGYSLNDIQVLCPMRKRDNLCSSTVINKMIQERINPKRPGMFDVTFNGITFREGDKVIQMKNNYEKEAYNGDVGYIQEVKKVSGEIQLVVKFDTEEEVTYVGREEILELDLAYAMTVHKSQGSEYKVILMPMVMSQKVMLYRNLFYTGVTRAKQIVELFGSKEAMKIAIDNIDNTKRNSKLADHIAATTIKFQ